MPKPVQFFAAGAGIVLVAMAETPPETPSDLALILGGAALTAFVTIKAGAREVDERSQRNNAAAKFWRRLKKRRFAVVGGVSLTVAFAFGVPPAVGAANGYTSNIWGCAPATQLNVLANPETVTAARRLAMAYESWTAEENYSCPTADVYVYSAPTDQIRKGLEDGWSDEALKLGPRPNVYLASTGHEVDRIKDPQPVEIGNPPEVDGARNAVGAVNRDRVRIAESTPFAVSPVVLAVPAAEAGQGDAPERTWPELFRELTDRGVPIVRAEPGSTGLGLLATALVYGPQDEGGSADPRRLEPAVVEQRIATALDADGFPLSDTLGLLCHHREIGSRAAVIASEQQVVLFNQAAPDGLCPPQQGQSTQLVPRYPSDTAVLDHQFVRMSGGGPEQEQAAIGFREWLETDDGRTSIMSTGLRPPGEFAVAPLLNTVHIDAGAARAARPLAADRWETARQQYRDAERRGRVLFVLDTSGSMAAAAPGGTRWSATARAVMDALEGKGPRDEFGVWFFPGTADSTGHDEAVPLGPTDRHDEVERTLQARLPTGGTPLFGAMAAGVAALDSIDPEQVNAVIVVTDGEDPSGRDGVGAVTAAAAGKAVRLIVVAIGESGCTAGGLDAIDSLPGGECRDVDVADLSTELVEVTAGLWGGG